MRKNAREASLKLIFESFFNDGNSILEICEECEVKSENDLAFVHNVYNSYKTNKEEIDMLIYSLGQQSKTATLFSVDRAIVCMAIAEHKLGEVPKAVIINECVELAKKFSTEKSFAFVNGILSKAIEE
ncbi:MAG: transcription antitermination factor NusB [Clostridia bacterium]